MTRRVSLLMLLVPPWLCGCGPRPADVQDPPVDPNGRAILLSASSGNGGATNGRPKQLRFVVSLRMVTVEVPIGTASGSEEVWSYLDEEPLHAIRSANLGRNGLRVGLGRRDSWPDMVRIFKRMTGRSPRQNLAAAIPGDPLPIVLKENQDVQTIFTFRDDRTLHGGDYPPGDNMLTIVCTLNPDDLSKVLLTAVPQIRTSRRETRFVLGESGPHVLVEPAVYSFPDLTFQLAIAPESFLVIGPGMAARNPSSVGHHFLLKQREGVEFETMLVLMPEVIAAPVP